MKKAFITGLTGFAGKHLSKLLLENDFEVSGTYLFEDSIEGLENRDRIDLHQLDLIDKDRTHEIIEKVRPDYIFHLAAIASPRQSFIDPMNTFTTNISGELNVLEAARDLGLLGSKILIISSAEVYGHVDPKDIPMDEETPFMPTNPYAVSKITQDYLALMYNLTHKLQIVRVRPFNHVGPGQAPIFAISAFAKKIVDVEKGRESVMKIGNLTSKRDFTDVRDMMRAYLLALEKGEVGEVYNLGSGKSYLMSDILNMMIGMSKAEIKTEQDPELMSPSDDPELLCDSSKFINLTGWKVEIPIEKTLKDTIDYWRAQN
jgi:GDP-4-dehydro-6-deoxy-D-mannose reductase